jgi:hypothetical protein
MLPPVDSQVDENSESEEADELSRKEQSQKQKNDHYCSTAYV